MSDRLTVMQNRVLLALLPVKNVGGVKGTLRAECQNMRDLVSKLGPEAKPAANALHQAGLVRTHTDYDHGWDWSITRKGEKAVTGKDPFGQGVAE